MAGKLKSVRLSNATSGKFDEIKEHYHMTNSDLLRIMVCYSITHEVELHEYIKRAANFIAYGIIEDGNYPEGLKHDINGVFTQVGNR